MKTFPGFHWIGLNCPAGGTVAVKTDWRWIDGTSPSFDGWASGQPDDPSRYGALSSGIYGVGWGNVPNTGWADKGIMEADAPVPIPGALWLLGSGLLGLVAIRRRQEKA